MNSELDNRWDSCWFRSFCTKDEIDRIRNPQNPTDFLLRNRADIVADNIRFERVYMNKARLDKQWSFEKSFIDIHYKDVLTNLTEEDRVRCKEITYGDMFANDVNGYAWKDEKWGRIISLNESLQFYMKFCNLAILEFKEEVPLYVRVNAMRIAIRILLKNEAMDFFMDPRGIVPKNVGMEIHRPIKNELQYIAGHEFAHHLCGHLDENNICKMAVLKIGEKEYFEMVYNKSQLEEFEADIEALNRPKYDEKDYANLLEGALIWFVSLGLGERALDIINPAASFQVKTHPSADERYKYIFGHAKIPQNFNLKKIEAIKENAKRMCEILEQDLSYNYSAYDVYGSCYLDKPNTKWRGRELIDRVDYY